MFTGRRNLGLFLASALLVGLGSPSSCPQASIQEEEKKPAEEKKEEKKKTKSAREASEERGTRKVLSRILRDFTNGLEALSPSSLRESIDDKKFYDFPRFEEGVTDFLRSAGEMRLYTREVNVQVENDKAVMIIEAEMAYAARLDPDRRERRRSRITFDFERTEAGWKITEINPRSFFLP